MRRAILFLAVATLSCGQEIAQTATRDPIATEAREVSCLDHEGGDGQEPNDTVVIPAYDYQVDPAADTWPRVFDRAGVGGRWRRNLSIDP